MKLKDMTPAEATFLLGSKIVTADEAAILLRMSRSQFDREIKNKLPSSAVINLDSTGRFWADQVYKFARDRAIPELE